MGIYRHEWHVLAPECRPKRCDRCERAKIFALLRLARPLAAREWLCSTCDPEREELPQAPRHYTSTFALIAAQTPCPWCSGPLFVLNWTPPVGETHALCESCNSRVSVNMLVKIPNFELRMMRDRHTAKLPPGGGNDV